MNDSDDAAQPAELENKHTMSGVTELESIKRVLAPPTPSELALRGEFTLVPLLVDGKVVGKFSDGQLAMRDRMIAAAAKPIFKEELQANLDGLLAELRDESQK